MRKNITGIPGDELRQNLTPPVLFEYTNVQITTDNGQGSLLVQGPCGDPEFQPQSRGNKAALGQDTSAAQLQDWLAVG